MATSLTSLKREFSVSEAYLYNQSSPLRWVFSHLWRYKGFLLFYLVTVIIMNALFSSIPTLTGRAFDIVLGQTDTGRLLTIALAILGIVVVRGVIDLSNALAIETLGQRLERDARDELYVSLLGKSQTFHNRQRVGDVMARATNDIRQLNPMINPGFSLMMDALTQFIDADDLYRLYQAATVAIAAYFCNIAGVGVVSLQSSASTGSGTRTQPVWRDECRPGRNNRRHRGRKIDGSGSAGAAQV